MSIPVSVVGTIATDPRLVTTSNGTVLCSFRLASSDRKYDREKQEWVEGETDWFTVTAFRTLATHAHASFRKGERAIISGKLRVRKWENGEKSGTNADLEADALGHDLRWGTTKFTRLSQATSSQDGNGANAADGQAGGAQQRWVTPADERHSEGSDVGGPHNGDAMAALTTSTGEASVDGFAPQVA